MLIELISCCDWETIRKNIFSVNGKGMLWVGRLLQLNDFYYTQSFDPHLQTLIL